MFRFIIPDNFLDEHQMFIQEEVVTQKEKNTIFKPSPKYFNVDKDGNLSDSLIVDQFECQDFFLAENGFKRSDIEQIIKAESAELQQMFMQKIGDYPNAANSDVPLSEVVSQVMPRYAQTPVSKRNWLEGQLDKPLRQYIDEHTQKSAPDSATIKFDGEPKSD